MATFCYIWFWVIVLSTRSFLMSDLMEKRAMFYSSLFCRFLQQFWFWIKTLVLLIQKSFISFIDSFYFLFSTGIVCLWHYQFSLNADMFFITVSVCEVDSQQCSTWFTAFSAVGQETSYCRPKCVFFIFNTVIQFVETVIKYVPKSERLYLLNHSRNSEGKW